MQTQALPLGSNVIFGFFPVMKATVLRRRYGRALSETTASIQSAAELKTFLNSAGYPATRLEAEVDFALYGHRTYTVEVR